MKYFPLQALYKASKLMKYSEITFDLESATFGSG